MNDVWKRDCDVLASQTHFHNMIKPVQKYPDLELPTDSPPIQAPPQISIDAMQGRIQELTQMFPQNAPTPEERFRTKVDVPFELKE